MDVNVVPPPPVVLAGHRYRAGLRYATVLPDLDFETYSEAGYVWDFQSGRWTGPPGAPANKKGLSVVGAAVYTAHPSCEVLSLSYDLKDGRGKRHWRPGLPPPADLFEHVRSGGLLEAWNVSFERWVWTNICVPRMGWPHVAFRQWRCAMAKARAFALPDGLAKAGEVLGCASQKDSTGTALLNRFSVPQKPTKVDPRMRVVPMWTIEDARREYGQHRPSTPLWKRFVQDHEDTLRFGAYNVQDIAAEAEVSSLTPDLEGEELEWWFIDQEINVRGVHMDRQGIEDCIAVLRQAFVKYNHELHQLTGIDSASKVEQLIGWLRGQGVYLDSLDEEAVEAALASKTLAPLARRVLEIRAVIGSASVKKVFAMRNALTTQDRLHDLFMFHAARTGRATGDGSQPTNLPKAGPNLVRCGTWTRGELLPGTGCGRHYAPQRLSCPWCGRPAIPAPPNGKDGRLHEWSPAAAEDALEALRLRSLEWLQWVFGDALKAIAGVLRGLFDAASGHDLISTDFNSIEAVGLAMLSNETWRVKVFESHGQIYEASAAMMYNVPFEDFARHKKETKQHHPLRAKGKIGELAFGYQGWLGAALAFGMPGEEHEIKSDILAWRRASPAIEWLWGGQTLGKAGRIVRNALEPGYQGTVDPAFAAMSDCYRWEDRPYYFGVEGAAVDAILHPDETFPVYRLDGTPSDIEFVCQSGILYCRLPSGRLLTYHAVRLDVSDRGGYSISYEGWNTNPKNGPRGWIRMQTWGGRLVENINQATCRDILRYAAINLTLRGYPIVLHVYDEIVAEVPEGFGSIEEFEAIVTRRPEWAKHWPIKAPGGWRGKRYRKA